MTVWVIHLAPVVWNDLQDIEDYYRIQAPEQLVRFRAEFEDVVEHIRQWPLLCKEDRPSVRHRAFRIFPFHVFYTVDEGEEVVTIAAVLHQRRNPAIAKLRLSD